MRKSTSLLLSVVLALAATLLFPGRARAQRRLSAINYLSLDESKTAIFGLQPRNAALRIGSMTLTNEGPVAALVGLRVVRPEDDVDCLGVAFVVQEVMSVAVPAGQTVHLPFPEILRVPNSRPDGPWCLLGLLFSPSAGPYVIITTVTR